MEPVATGLAAGPEAGEGRAAARIDLDAPHVEMGGGRDRDGVVDGIDARLAAIARHGGEARENGRAEGRSRVEKDLMALADLGKVGAGDDVARGELGIGMDGRHEALACLVDEDGAFATEGLGGEGRRICTGGDGRGVELDEFGIGD